jgi:hypothetical protein
MRKSITARPASAWLALAGMPATNGVTGHLLDADVGFAAQHDQAGEPCGAAGAVFRFRLHRGGDAELLENFCEVNAALAAADRF